MFDVCIKYSISDEEKKKFFLKKTGSVRITGNLNKCNDVIFKPESFEDLQKAVNSKMPLGIIDSEQLFEKNSLHYVKSGIDDSVGKLMGRKKIALVFNLKQLLVQKGIGRSITVERMRRNMGYAVKYKIPVLFASQAGSKFELFNGIMIKSIAKVLGLKDWKWAVESYNRSVQS